MTESQSKRRLRIGSTVILAIGGTLILAAMYMIMGSSYPGSPVNLGILAYGFIFGFLGFLLIGFAWQDLQR